MRTPKMAAIVGATSMMLAEGNVAGLTFFPETMKGTQESWKERLP